MSKSIRKLILFAIPLLVIGFIVSQLYKWNYIQHTQHIPEEFNIPDLGSGADYNKNRVDDSKDIFLGAYNYMSTNPKYEALREYTGGWPNGSFGTNGDVVARALRNAGYDLMTLINDDIKKNPKAYEGKVINENVAFRDVETQRTFFSRYADPLDTDYHNKNAWQAGDIIFFEKNHCAIVADKVNENGIRFIIHHFWEFQGGYYQDVLETEAWGKVTGHYRITERITAITTQKN